MPHERDLRGWLRSRVLAADDVEDVVQECYCQLAQLPSVSHIVEPRAYLFAMARNLANRQRRRARVVRIEPIAQVESSELASDQPLPDRIAAGRQELDRVRAALGTLSDRARKIFLLRRIEGLSQKEIAARLGVTEAVVENDASRSLRAILRMLTEPAEVVPPAKEGKAHARSR
ncbi:RNA polymerase sigma factor [Sphingomonas faeni]|uniref:RNA polymerase sigma factor n=1 Tax=Sphingomonas faeni TaxID=185950 RepID=UPI0020C78832|nr:RNA polymerase sigma factor [Sphingomonas faeni]MCP8892061.1 RNA polymerase sigma factor [Sphingomonas faeni]